jgi:hypothetical protein
MSGELESRELASGPAFPLQADAFNVVKPPPFLRPSPTSMPVTTS